MKYIFGTLVTIFLFTITTFANSGIIAGNDADEHGCIGSAGYSWNETTKTCERPWEHKIYNTSSDFLASEGLTCKVASDGCNNVQINNGQLGAMTQMYCENTYGSGAKEQWSCLDEKLEQDTIGFLSTDEQAEYKEITKLLGEKISTKITTLVNNFGDKVLENTKYDMPKSYKILDKAIAKIQLRLMTSKYANQTMYAKVRLLKYELMIIKHRWENNTGVSSK